MSLYFALLRVFNYIVHCKIFENKLYSGFDQFYDNAIFTLDFIASVSSKKVGKNI